VRTDGSRHVVQVLGRLALDLAEDGIKRMLERAVQAVALRRSELVEILVDPLARVLQDVFAREHRPGDVVQHLTDWSVTCLGARLFSNRPCGLRHLYTRDSTLLQTASANAIVDAVPPRSRVRTRLSMSTSASPCMMRSAAAASPM